MKLDMTGMDAATALVSVKFAEGVADSVGKAFVLAAEGGGNHANCLTTAHVLQMSSGAMQGYVTAIIKHMGKGAAAAIVHQISIDNGLGLVRKQP